MSDLTVHSRAKDYNPPNKQSLGTTLTTTETIGSALRSPVYGLAAEALFPWLTWTYDRQVIITASVKSAKRTLSTGTQLWTWTIQKLCITIMLGIVKNCCKIKLCCSFGWKKRYAIPFCIKYNMSMRHVHKLHLWLHTQNGNQHLTIFCSY